MPITQVDKIKLNKYLREHKLGNLYYGDMVDILGKKTKITYNEFVEYFTGYIIDTFEHGVNCSINHLTKMIAVVQAILVWAHESGTKIGNDSLQKIRRFRDAYDGYITRNNLEVDLTFRDNYIGVLLECADELFPVEEEVENVINSTDEANLLKEELGCLRKELKQSQQELSNINKSYDKLKNSYTKQTDKVDNLQQKLKTKDQESIQLNEKITSLTAEISELKEVLSEVKSDNEQLQRYKDQFNLLSVEADSLRKNVKDNNRARDAQFKLKKKHLNIQGLIYQKLLSEKATDDELLECVRANGFACDRDELHYLLGKMSQKININDRVFAQKPVYQITAPNLFRKAPFTINIPNGSKFFDVILVSDLHLEHFGDKVLTKLTALSDYCVKNGINLVLNLGDFYHGYVSRPLNYESAVKNYSIIEKTVELFPKADGLYHAVLSGNHERNIANYGFDSIQLLSEARNDFINLGYTHASISLENTTGVLGQFGICHPNSFDFPIELDDNGIDIGAIDGYLREVYNRQGKSRDDFYIDALGHTHRSQFNCPGSYCFVPSYFSGGAYHWRFYFDEDKEIKYMVSMPLSFDDNIKLIKNNEIIYQKSLKR